ncbi:hypothetical protein C4546_02870 [Candidatus Parcubacteria bacterium]|jgi:lipoprotein-anchoring transpeptidase ErfK/SrfK|nr:MAG: hypothetical protein C4546_02870 [Candidatus Parcubacteria bacterium]
MQKNQAIFRVLIVGIVVLASLGFAKITQAAQYQAGLFDASGKLLQKIPNIQPGSNVTTADLDNDGITEILYGTAAGKDPGIRILKLDGTVLKNIKLPSVKNNPTVRIAVGDVNGDGEKDLVVGFGKGTTPEIWILDREGKRLKTFLAYERKFKGGVFLDAADIDGDGKSEIVVAPGAGGGPRILIFNAQGQILQKFWAYPQNSHTGVIPQAIDVDNDGLAEIVTSKLENNSLVKIFKPSGILAATFKTANAFPNAVRIAENLNQNQKEIILASAPGAAGQVLSYTTDGKAGKIKFFPFGKNYTQGLSIATVDIDQDANMEIIAVPGKIETSDSVSSKGKLIVVDISDQKMRRYENGQLIATHRVSTGKWSMPTPLGNFSIHNKINTAYSRRYALYMDNWMAFTPDGAYGIHSLSYWRLKNGGIYYEGTNHLGTRVSHGCIRLSPKESVVVFSWTGIGTPVKVQN